MATEPMEYEVQELSREEGWKLLDEESWRLLGMPAEEFLTKWDMGELDYDDAPGVSSVAFLIPFAR